MMQDNQTAQLHFGAVDGNDNHDEDNHSAAGPTEHDLDGEFDFSERQLVLIPALRELDARVNARNEHDRKAYAELRRRIEDLEKENEKLKNQKSNPMAEVEPTSTAQQSAGLSISREVIVASASGPDDDVEEAFGQELDACRRKACQSEKHDLERDRDDSLATTRQCQEELQEVRELMWRLEGKVQEKSEESEAWRRGFIKEQCLRLRLNQKLHEFSPMVVIGRLRMALQHETGEPYIKCGDSSGKLVIEKMDSRNGQTPESSCTFDKLYEAEASNDDLWDNDVAPFVDNVLRGERVLILAYGASNSGKTHTMRGDQSQNQEGMIQQAIFGLLEKTNDELKASVVEFVGGEIHDLHHERKLEVYDSGDHVYKLRVPGDRNQLSELVGQDADADKIYRFYEAAEKKRRTRDMTELQGSVQGSNKQSSRGHVIFTLHVGDGRLAFVDLAGSEATPAPDDKPELDESTAIKKDLGALFGILAKMRKEWRQDSKLVAANTPMATVLGQYATTFPKVLDGMLNLGLPNFSKPRILIIGTFSPYDDVQRRPQEIIMEYFKNLLGEDSAASTKHKKKNKKGGKKNKRSK